MPFDGQRQCPCGCRYDAAQWSALRLVQRLAPEEVASHVTSWPAHLAVEVRECSRCARGISRVDRESRMRLRPHHEAPAPA